MAPMIPFYANRKYLGREYVAVVPQKGEIVVWEDRRCYRRCYRVTEIMHKLVVDRLYGKIFEIEVHLTQTTTPKARV